MNTSGAGSGGASSSSYAYASSSDAEGHLPILRPWPLIVDLGPFEANAGLSTAQRAAGGRTAQGLMTHEQLQQQGFDNRDNKVGIFALDEAGESMHHASSAAGGNGNKDKPKKTRFTENPQDSVESVVVFKSTGCVATHVNGKEPTYADGEKQTAVIVRAIRVSGAKDPTTAAVSNGAFDGKAFLRLVGAVTKATLVESLNHLVPAPLGALKSTGAMDKLSLKVIARITGEYYLWDDKRSGLALSIKRLNAVLEILASIEDPFPVPDNSDPNRKKKAAFAALGGHTLPRSSSSSSAAAGAITSFFPATSSASSAPKPPVPVREAIASIGALYDKAIEALTAAKEAKADSIA